MKAKEGVVNILNKVLTADLTAINQYFVHAKMCENWGYERLHQRVAETALDEDVDAPPPALVGVGDTPPATRSRLPGDDLALRLDYAESRFTDQSMHALVAQVAEVLGSFAVAADQPVAALALPSAHRARTDLARWNDTARSPWDRTSVQIGRAHV